MQLNINSAIRNRDKLLKDILLPFALLIVLLLSFAAVASVIPKTLAAQVTMDVYQQKGKKAFGNKTSLDIFNDPKFNGQKLIAPYTAGSYTFAVFNNSASQPLPYSIALEGQNQDNIPLVFSLQKNGAYIYGGKNDMLPLSQYKLKDAELKGRKTDLYTLKWKWKTTNDRMDTQLGNRENLKYSLLLTAVGTINNVIVTGDAFNIHLWIIILCVSAVLLIVLYRKKVKA